MNEQLTKRQIEAVTQVASGLSNKRAAEALRISEGSLEKHLENARKAIGFCPQLQPRVILTRWAVEKGLVAPMFALLLFAGCSTTETQEQKTNTLRPNAAVQLPPSPFTETIQRISSNQVARATLVAPTQVTIPITLAWDASDWPDVAGYRIYRGGESQKYTNSVVVGSNLIVTLNLPIQKHHIAVTAFDSNGAESVATAEIIETSEYQNAVKITSRHAPTPSGSWTNGVVVWHKTNAPVPQLYLDYLIEATNRAVWK